MDPATQRNLEVFKTTANTRVGSLLDVMDQTSSAAGSRLLERFLGAPEKNLNEILRRQSAVKDFSTRPSLVSKIEEIFRSGSDIERILGRLQNRMARPREVGGVRTMLRGLPALKKILLEVGTESASIQALAEGVNTFDPLRELLEQSLEEELPAEIKVDVKGQSGFRFRNGYDEDFDQLREMATGVSDGSQSLRAVKGKVQVSPTLR